jgi:hypothetical protein
MPRLSLYKPEKGNDYKFIDRQSSEMFQAGGTDVYLHKYLGPALKTSGTGDQPVYATQNVANIQDLLFSRLFVYVFLRLRQVPFPLWALVSQRWRWYHGSRGFHR